jgi:phosphoglucosamine mutase
MAKLFGTDGIRGRAGSPPLDGLTVQRIGRAVIRALGVNKPRVLIGRDPRESSSAIEAQVASGLVAEGATVVSTGVLPTPGVAYLARYHGFDLGTVISASHNPYEDNGIKFFGGAGRKFTEALEEATEAELGRVGHETLAPITLPVEDLSSKYLTHLREAIPGLNLSGLRIVIDCANGATSRLAPELYRGLGADILVRHDKPDGRNINHGCGATSPADLAQAVRASAADLGVAFDGDGDRAIFSDAEGRVVNGDAVLFIAARHLQAEGRLRGGCVVATVMSNLGLEHALNALQIALVRTPVGDRHVLDEMERRGANLGGEQSGHVIFLDHEPAGDGLMTALQILAVVSATGRRLGEIAAELNLYPQAHRNVRVREKVDLERIESVRAALASAHETLDGKGRLLVRYSGTEPLLRIMAEGPDERVVARAADTVARAATAALGF